MLKISAKDISATDIRNRIKANKPLNQLMPSLVKDYIYKHKLYAAVFITFFLLLSANFAYSSQDTSVSVITRSQEMIEKEKSLREKMISLRSKVAIKLLDYYFLNPDAQVYINELARILDFDPKNTETKLKEFEEKGFFKSEFRGKERYFFLAKDNPVLEHYRQIFLKTYGIEKRLKNMLSDIKGLKEAYIFGSYANNKMDSSSDIDVLAIGSHSVLELQRVIAKLQKNTSREFNVMNLSLKEFETKKKNKDPFINSVFKTKIIRLI